MVKLRQGPPLLKLPTGQHVLLNELWNKHGGLRRAAKKIGIPEYQLNVWRHRGGVPMKHIRLVGLKLGVSLAALNYADMFAITGPNTITWENAVKSCGFSKELIKKILKNKPPQYK